MSLWGNDDKKDEAAAATPDVTVPVNNDAVPAAPSMPPASDVPTPMPSADAVDPNVGAVPAAPQAGAEMGAGASTPSEPNPEEVSMADEVPAAQPPVESTVPASPAMPADPVDPAAAAPSAGEEPKV